MTELNKLSDLRINRFNESLTQGEMAINLELSKVQQYQRYEYEPTNISKNTLERASLFFKVSPQYFLDNSYGDIICRAPYFKDYNFKKKRIIYYEFEDKSQDIKIKNNNNFITDYFILNFDQQMLSRMAISQYTRSYSRNHKRNSSEPKLLSFDEDATFVDNKDEPVVKFLMKKANLNDIKSQKSPNLYLARNMSSKKLFLIYIEKLNNDDYNVIGIYDFDRNIIINLCPSFALEDTFFPGGTSFIYKDIELSNLHIIGKTISIWNPNNLFPFTEDNRY